MSIIALLSGSPPAAGASYLVSDNLEYADATAAGVGGWTTNGTPTWGYATAPAPLEGTKSFRSTASTAYATISFSAQSDVWAYFLVNVAATTSTSAVVKFLDGTSTVVATFTVASSGVVRANSGGGTDNSSAAGEIVAATTYHVWLHYQKGTGANAVLAVYRSLDGIKPVSPSANRVLGTSTTDATQIRIGASSATIFDKVRVSATSIGDNPT